MRPLPYIRKISAACFAVLVFIVFSSFSVLASIGGTDTDEAERTIILIDEDGNEFEVEKADDTNISDILEGSREAAKKLDEENSQERSQEDSVNSVFVYEEGRGLKEAGFEDDWSLILINKKHLIPSDYRFELATIKGNIKSDVRVVEHVNSLLQAAKDDGVDIFICSPYRDEEKQQKLFEKKVAQYERKGYDHEKAFDLASETVAIPGSSEHQVGLAFDFVTPKYQRLDEGFAETDAGKWLAKNAPDHGFILRYPADKVSVTDIEFEPWHYRYVGVKAAKEMTKLNLSLEEYDEMIGLVQ
ncbi:MAG: M15 family metallopeptidase [Lachnospiraceae bacterium]|nr:M15 family metallopeptidase [Lachnospiraceae bacterium]